MGPISGANCGVCGGGTVGEGSDHPIVFGSRRRWHVGVLLFFKSDMLACCCVWDGTIPALSPSESRGDWDSGVGLSASFGLPTKTSIMGMIVFL